MLPGLGSRELACGQCHVQMAQLKPHTVSAVRPKSRVLMQVVVFGFKFKLTLFDNGLRKQAALARKDMYSPSLRLKRKIELSKRFRDCNAAR